MQDGKLETIVIVGGGSAGWMSAAYLAEEFPDIEITLVESSDIPVIGVGEATITTISGFLSRLGLREPEWMPACNASFKYGIRFNDWLGPGTHYWHPFEVIPYFGPRQHLGHYWYRKQLDSGRIDADTLYSDCFLSVGLMRGNKILKTRGGADYVHTCTLQDADRRYPLQVPYAYHFDAGLFGAYLKDRCTRGGTVRHVVDEVTGVHLNEQGFIRSLATAGGREIRGDLFLDCTGFRSLLLEKALHEPFDSYADALFIDRAIAMRVPYRDPESEMHPYTTATAKTAGWVWNIPVADRIGSGYVYCSSFLTEDEAESELRSHWGGQRTDGLEVRKLDISRVGRHRHAWVKNCVAIGLSSGFLEPLESTSLHFVYAGVAKLSEALGDGYYNTATVSAYNSFMASMMEEARDFIVTHYALTRREDTPFWKEVKYSSRVPDTLAGFLAGCRLALPERNPQQIVFKYSSWTCILAGMNFFPNPAGYGNLLQQDIVHHERMKKALKRLGTKLQDSAVNHYRYVRSLAG